MICECGEVVRSSAPTCWNCGCEVNSDALEYLNEQSEVSARANMYSEVARDHAAGDPVVEEILKWHLIYNNGRLAEPFVLDRMTNRLRFWTVGRNASHQFQAGTDGLGGRYRRAIGESVDLDELGVPEFEELVSKVADFDGYYGHY